MDRGRPRGVRKGFHEGLPPAVSGKAGAVEMKTLHNSLRSRAHQLKNGSFTIVADPELALSSGLRLFKRPIAAENLLVLNCHSAQQ